MVEAILIGLGFVGLAALISAVVGDAVRPLKEAIDELMDEVTELRSMMEDSVPVPEDDDDLWE